MLFLIFFWEKIKRTVLVIGFNTQKVVCFNFLFEKIKENAVFKTHLIVF